MSVSTFFRQLYSASTFEDKEQIRDRHIHFFRQTSPSRLNHRTPKLLEDNKKEQLIFVSVNFRAFQ